LKKLHNKEQKLSTNTPTNLSFARLKMSNILTNAALCTFGLQFVGFVAASILKTETFYDVLGGCNFLLLALIGYSFGSTRLTYMTALFVVSRSWLLVFLAWRAHSRKGDSRFDEVIGKPLLFFVYWMVQACWVYLISLPLLLVQIDSNGALSTMDWILMGGFAFGILLEISSDIQKTMWVNQGRLGGFCRTGWWQYSRHPNYAGEICQWCCAAGLCSSWVGIASPLFTMTILLTLKGTGIWNAEGKNLKRYYESAYAKEYIQYRKSTSPLIPMIGYGPIPLALKRWCLFEWERYEYKLANSETKNK
jgi:steroid 5-alpha reductase family enzyme